MYQIVYEPHEVYTFAAEELARYYAKITGEILLQYPGQKNEEGIPIVLGSPRFIEEITGLQTPIQQLRYDGYWLHVEKDCIVITGKEPRSIVYGVYDLLETAGCRWMFPGPEGEIIPAVPALQFEPCDKIENPDFEVRASTDDTRMDEIPDSYVIETLEKFDWAAKNRLNTYFMAVNLITGDMYLKPMIMREITKRGFRLEIGGHNTWQFVSRDLFETDPTLFREVDGVRRADGNFCSSNPKAVQMVIDGVGRLIKQIPSVACFHLWFEDTFGGSWCSCEKCRDLSPAQQMLNVIGAVAKAYPQLHVDFILYHDSGDISSIQQQLPSNISAYYAPRERCYSHRISDPHCQRNREYYKQLTHAARHFSSVYPFEYYTDMILFNKMATNLQKTLHEDFEDYKENGVNAVTLLMFNRYSWFAYKLAMVTFARTAWSLSCDYMAVRQELCDIYYGSCSHYMMQYYQLQEEFTRYMLEFCGYDDVHDIRNIIPLNPEFSTQHLADIEKAQAILQQMDQILNEALATVKDVKIQYLLNSEKISVQFTEQTASITYRLMKARHEQAFEQLPDEEFDQVMDELIEAHKSLAAQGMQVPLSLVGINGKTLFQNHLCYDLNIFYNSLKSQGTKKDFKTF